MTDEKNMRDMCHRIAAALCLASVTEGRAGVSLALGLSVTATVLISVGVVILSSLFATRVSARLCGNVISVCTGTALASLVTAYFRFTGLSAGIFFAAAVTAALILGLGGSNGHSITNATVSGALFTVIITVAGAVRELFGAGMIFDTEVEFLTNYTIGVLKAPAGGMMVCAVLSAVLCGIFNSKGERCDDGH